MTGPRSGQTWIAKICGEVRTIQVVLGPDDFSDGVVIARVMDGEHVVQSIRLHIDQMLMQVPDLVT
jgi:hypothetical protein